MKKALSLVLSIIMIFTLVPMAFAEGEECAHENYTWIYEGLDDDYDCVVEEGQRYKACADCGEAIDSVKESVPVQPNHRWIESSRDSAACVKPENEADIPYIYYECTLCDATKKVEQSYSGHSWSAWSVLVKCFEGEDHYKAGTYQRTCEGCGATETKAIADHVYITMAGTAPTCHKDGQTEYRRCYTCATVAPNEVIPKLPHIDENADTKCDLCDGLMAADGSACRCICHNQMEIIQKLILPILKILWGILKMDTCNCGAAH